MSESIRRPCKNVEREMTIQDFMVSKGETPVFDFDDFMEMYAEPTRRDESGRAIYDLVDLVSVWEQWLDEHHEARQRRRGSGA